MTEDSETHEPRIARIRENLVDALGDFEEMARVIASSQHGPDSSGLFGVAQSPLTPFPRSASRGNPFAVPQSFSSTLSTAQMLQSMQNLVDTPLSAIETNLPFKKVQEKKSVVKGAVSQESPSTSSESADRRNRQNGVVRQRDDDDSRRKRKRRRSGERTEDGAEKECENRDGQKPCSSSAAPPRENTEEGRMTINDLFGDEKKELASKMMKLDESRKEERKGTRWKKEEGESPDSGFVDETGDSDREHPHHTGLESIIEDLGRVSPILSPPRQPSLRLPQLTFNDGVPSLKCFIDVSAIPPAGRRRLQSKLSTMEHATIAPPRPVLSPPRRPSSKAALVLSPIPRERTNSPKPPPQNVTPQNNSPKPPPPPPPPTTTTTSSDSTTTTTAVDVTPKRATVKDTASHHLKHNNNNTASHPSPKRRELIKKDRASSRVASPIPPIVGDKEIVEGNKDHRVTADVTSAKKDSKENTSSLSTSPARSLKEKIKDRSREAIKANSSPQQQRVPSPSIAKMKEKKQKTRDKEKERRNDENRSRSEKQKETKEKPSVVQKPEKTTREEKRPESGAKRETSSKKAPSNDGTESSSNKSTKCDEFACCAQSVPKHLVEIEKNEDGSYKDSGFYHNDRARPTKHRADHEDEHAVRKVLLYVEAVVYFIYSVAVQLPTRDQRPYAMLRETANLLKSTTNRFTEPRARHSPLVDHFVSRVKLISARAQAVLNYQLYKWRQNEARKNSGAWLKFDRSNAEKEALAKRTEAVVAGSQSVRSAATPSPASSTHSAANAEKAKEVAIPVVYYKMMKDQMSILNHLLWSDQIWNDSNAAMNDLDRGLVEQLDSVCGRLNRESDLFALCQYMATGAAWLRAEYDLEKNGADAGKTR